MTDEERRRLSLQLKDISRRLERDIARRVGRRLAFSVIIWGDFGDDHMVQYVANAKREDCMHEMLALIDGWLAGMPDIPFHERQ
jgi:hypothetical protein